MAQILRRVNKILSGNGKFTIIPISNIANRMAMNIPIFHPFFTSLINKDRIKPAGKKVKTSFVK
jgi:hypothetical protein